MEQTSPVELSFENTSYEASKVANLIEDEEKDILFPQRPKKLTTRFALPHEGTALSELTPPPSPPRQSSPERVSFAPFLNRSGQVPSSRQSISPTRSAKSEDEKSETPSKSQGRTWKKPGKTLEAFADLFSGTSAPIFPGPASSPSSSPRREISFETSMRSSPVRSGPRPSQSRRSSTLSVAATLLGLAPPKRQAPMRRLEEPDEVLELDLEHELFPTGFPDPTSPTAFDELLSSAEKLFLRMQNAYSDKCRQLEESTFAHNIEREELDEARTKASHLKLQLDGMSAQFEEHNQAMKSLSDELLAERQRRKHDQELRTRNVIRVVGSDTDPSSVKHPEHGQNFHHLLVDSEDDSCAESVFSRPGSSLSSMTTSTNPENVQGQHTLAPNGAMTLREENRFLKARIAELEDTVENCLGLVNVS